MLKAILARLFVGSRPFPKTLLPLMRLSGHSRSQETKWCSSSHLLISHPASLRMVAAVTTSMPSTWVRSVPVMRNNSARKANPGLFPFFLTSRPFRVSWGRLAPWLRSVPLLEILLELAIALCDLLLAKLITFLLLLQHEQQVFLPVALQIPRDLFLACLHPRIPQRSQLMRITFARQNGLEDGLSSHPANIAQYIAQLDIHLRQRL